MPGRDAATALRTCGVSVVVARREPVPGDGSPQLVGGSVESENVGNDAVGQNITPAMGALGCSEIAAGTGGIHLISLVKCESPSRMAGAWFVAGLRRLEQELAFNEQVGRS